MDELENMFSKPLRAIEIFKQADLACIDSPEYLQLQCEVRGVDREDLFWTMLAGVQYDCIYGAMLHLIKDTGFFDEFLGDSRLVDYMSLTWMTDGPAPVSFWKHDVCKLSNDWRSLDGIDSWSWGYVGLTENDELKS